MLNLKLEISESDILYFITNAILNFPLKKIILELF